MNNKQKQKKLKVRKCSTPGCWRLTLRGMCERCRFASIPVSALGRAQ